MNLQAFREFLAIIQYGGFKKAAEELYITQSSLSKHIRKMESELGVSLFDRSGRRTTLTQAGTLLVPYAEQIVNLETQYSAALRSYAVNAQYTLNIGTVHDIAAYNISDIFVQFQQSYPSIQLNISSQSPILVNQNLLNGTFDLAFYRYRPDDDLDGLSIIPFTDDRLVAVCTDDHPLAGCRSVPLSALKNERLIGFQKDTFMSNFVLKSCLKSGFDPTFSMYSQQTKNQIILASHGMGSCLVMQKVAQRNMQPNVVMVDIDPPHLCRIDLCYLKGHKLSPAAQKFIQFVQIWKSTNDVPG